MPNTPASSPQHHRGPRDCCPETHPQHPVGRTKACKWAGSGVTLLFGASLIVGCLWERRTSLDGPGEASLLTWVVPVIWEVFTVSCEGSVAPGRTTACLGPSRAIVLKPLDTCQPWTRVGGGGGARRASLSAPAWWSRPPLPLSQQTVCACVSCRVITGKCSAPSCPGPWLALLPKRQ